MMLKPALTQVRCSAQQYLHFTRPGRRTQRNTFQEGSFTAPTLTRKETEAQGCWTVCPRLHRCIVQACPEVAGKENGVWEDVPGFSGNPIHQASPLGRADADEGLRLCMWLTGPYPGYRGGFLPSQLHSWPNVSVQISCVEHDVHFPQHGKFIPYLLSLVELSYPSALSLVVSSSRKLCPLFPAPKFPKIPSAQAPCLLPGTVTRLRFSKAGYLTLSSFGPTGKPVKVSKPGTIYFSQGK